MYRALLVAVVLLSITTSSSAKIQIDNIQACYGPFGPERRSMELFPFDNLFVRFTVTGLKTDATGKADTVVKMKFLDPKGNLIGENMFFPAGVLNLGGNSFLAFVNLRMSEQVPIGKNTLTVTITDNLSKESASFDREVTGRKPKFQIVGLEFFHDADGKLPASTHASVGEPLHFRLRVIGFDRSKEKINLEMALQTLNADGKENLPKPLTFDFREEDAKTVPRTSFVFLNNSVGLNRAGKFTLRITINDKIAKRSTQLEVPVTVTAP